MVTNTVHAIFCYVFKKKKTVAKITVAFDIQHTAKTGPKNISSAETLFPLLIIESLLEFVLFIRNFLIVIGFFWCLQIHRLFFHIQICEEVQRNTGTNNSASTLSLKKVT